MRIEKWKIRLLKKRMLGRVKWHWGKLSRRHWKTSDDLMIWESCHKRLGEDLRVLVKTAKSALAEHRHCTDIGCGCSYKDMRTDLYNLKVWSGGAHELACTAQRKSSDEFQRAYEQAHR